MNPARLVTIARDPNARVDTLRERADHPWECSWCGAQRLNVGASPDPRLGGGGRPVKTLYHYGTEGYGMMRRQNIDRTRAFCSVGCWRTYHGGRG